MHRFYCATADLNQSVIRIDNSQEIHHMLNVLRLKKGAWVCVFNGSGSEAEGPIIRRSQTGVEIKVERVRSTIAPVEQPGLILACAIPKQAKFEFIVEKCTELGVDEIVPLLTKRTEVRPDPVRAKRKRERFRRVAVNAAKQCQRVTVPDIKPITPFCDFLSSLRPGSTVFIPCLEGQRKGLADLILRKIQTKQIIFLIGPEGDFTPAEIALAVKHGCQPVSLGPTTLKVDTAAIGVIAFVNFLLHR